MKRKQYKVPDSQISMFDFDHPNMPVLDVSRCEAKLINYETAARMVETYHYAHRVPSIVVAVGMFVDGVLAGVCTYGIPPGREVLAVCGDEYIPNALELNRLFIQDYVGRNGESWLIGQSFKLMPSKYFVLVSYADTKECHMGYVYQATNWIYTGLAEGNGSGEFFINGEKFHPKAVYNNYNTNDQIELRALGLRVEIVKRSPKHRYVYFLGNRRQRRELRKALKWPVLPYPKAGQ